MKNSRDDDLMKLTVKNYECYARPQNDMVGHIRDTCYEFNYTFNTGIYFLTGEIDVGAWSFAYSLLDDARDACVSHYESMTLNGNPVTLSELRKMSFHVGQYKMYGKKSFEDVLKKTLKKSNINCSYEDMVNRFPFENMVAEASRWRMHFVNQKIWYISSLIGLALNKKIFVFPWLSKKDYLSVRCLT